ncbi:MAG: 6-pyruvoyl-tetrahydropterin synthase-related protein, partial [Acidobacteriota bacterium]
MKQWLVALITSCSISVAVITPFFLIGERRGEGCCGGAMPVTHDMAMHLNQMKGFHEGLRAGRIFPRWQENTNRGFGAPTTIFYPPAVYYVTSILYFVTGDWVRVIKALYVVVMTLSGLAIFALAKRFFSYGASLTAMAVYLVAPYHLLNHYQRGALAECLTFIWMPLTLVFVTDLIRHRREGSPAPFAKVAGLALTWGLFLCSHPPTAYQFLLIGGPIIVIAGLIDGRKGELAYVFGGLILGFALSSAYLLPAIAEQGYIHSTDVEETWPYHESYVFQMASRRYDHQADDFVMRLDSIWLITLAGIVGLTIALTTLDRMRANVRHKAGRSFWLWVIA